MTALLLLTLLLAQPIEADVKLVSPADTPRATYRWRLLPDLLEQTSDDAVPLARKAQETLNLAIADRVSLWQGKLNTLETEPLDEIEPATFDAVLKPANEALALYTRAALAGRADYSQERVHLRKYGFSAGGVAVPEYTAGVQLFAVRARSHLRRDRPDEAVRDLSLGFALVRHLDSAPGVSCHHAAFEGADRLLTVLAECQTHPKCPCLADALSRLPRPLISPRMAIEGLRLLTHGSLPEAGKILNNPGTEGLIDDEGTRRLVTAYRRLVGYAGRSVSSLSARLEMGRAIQLADAEARKTLHLAGYPDAQVKTAPALNVAILHAILTAEETLGQAAVILALADPDRDSKLDALERALLRDGPETPALPMGRFLINQARTLALLAPQIEQRLDQIRVVEALRFHAQRSGSWPAKLQAITGVAVPNDPQTGQPFEYQREGDIAQLGELKLKLRQPQEKKP